MEEPQKSLDDWREYLKANGNKGYLAFYSEMLGSPVSNIPRFFRALKMYGEWPIFEAILASSERSLNGDTLNYVLKVAHEMWKEDKQDDEESAQYLEDIRQSIDINEKYNEDLEKKLKKARGL